jgi:hypothetical protein
MRAVGAGGPVAVSYRGAYSAGGSIEVVSAGTAESHGVGGAGEPLIIDVRASRAESSIDIEPFVTGERSGGI